MTSYNKPAMGAAALAMLMALPGAAFSAVDHVPAIGGRADDRATRGVEIAHMGGAGAGAGMMRPDYGPYGYPCHGYEPRMGRDAPGGMMGRGMMGSDIGGASEDSGRVVPSRDLTIEDVRHFLEHRLETRGNKRLKVGAVTAQDDDRIVAEIMTVDDSLVELLEVDRHTGGMRQVE